MYEKYSDRARKVLHIANNEAQNLSQEYVGTEHLLLALLKEGSGVAASILRNLNVDYCASKEAIGKRVQPGSILATMGKLPKTPRLKKVLEYADSESQNLGHNYIGTEHLLLGLLREDGGIAHQVLKDFGLHLDTVRKEVVEILSWEPSDEEKKGIPECETLEVKEQVRETLSELKPLLMRQIDLLEKLTNILGDQ